MTDVLIYGDTERSPALRHEIPLGIGDPFLYLEHEGRRSAVVNALESDRVRALGLDLEIISPEELGMDELIAAGTSRPDIERALALRAVQRVGVTDAVVPPEFPLAVADTLREAGVVLRPDDGFFSTRRRAKTAAEIAGVRRAQAAAEAAMGTIAAMLRAAGVDGEGMLVDEAGVVLTSESVRTAARAAAGAAGATLAADAIVAAGGQGASGHDPGSGPLPAGVPIICDLWPQDEASACFADMTRTFVAGAAPSERTQEQWELCRESLRRVAEAARPGITGRELWEISCEPFEAAGHPTQRTKQPGVQLHEGYFHGLGHGVGLDVHEEPGVGRVGQHALQPGDVIAVEPGTYDAGSGGVRLEDLLLITEDGCEVLTRFPYDLAP